MKPFVLLGIDKYQGKRLICVVEADDIASAARKLGGEARDPVIVGEQSPERLYFDRGQECAAFVPGNCTDEVLAAAAAKVGSEAEGRLAAFYRYGTDNVYRGYVLGTAPVLR